MGLWFDPENQTWMDGDKVRLTDEEAAAEATRMRDQLIEVASLVALLPAQASDGPYIQLQRQLERDHPDLAHIDFVHKYLALLFPDRLDQFHIAYARFVLTKCLQVPIRVSSMPGLYENGGRFANMAAELDIPMNHLCLVLGELAGDPHGYRLLSTTEAQWNTMVLEGSIRLQWPEPSQDDFPKRGDFTPHDQVILNALPHFYPNDDPAATIERWQFIRWATSAGDLVVAHAGRRVLGIARLTGDHYFEESQALDYRLPIKILDTQPWALTNEDSAQAGFKRAGSRLAVEVERRLVEVLG